MREHLQQVEKTLGRKPKELEQPERPEELEYVWLWYLELRSDTPLTFTEIKHWSELMQTSPEVWEVEVIKALDRIYWREIND